MIKEIYLENFKSHKETKLELKKGTNLIIGIMGSGKSSVLDAISYALFGTFPKLKSRKIGINNTIKRGKDNAKIKLIFEWKGKEYEIERIIKKNKTDAKIKENGKILEKGQKLVTEMVKKILSIDYELFSKAIYSEQNAITYFLNLSPGERKNEIDKLLGLDQFENARKNLTQIANQIKQILEFYKKQYNEGKAKETKEEIEKITKEINENKEKYGKINQKLEDYKKEEKEIYEEYEKMLKNKKEKEHLERKLLINKTKMEQLNSNEIKKEKILEMKKKLEEEIKKQNEINKKKEEIRKKIKNMEMEIWKNEKILEKINDTKKEIKKLEELKKVKKEEEELEEEIKKLEEEIKNNLLIKEKIKTMEKELEELKKVKTNCPICGNILSEEHKEKIRKEKEEIINKLKTKIKNNLEFEKRKKEEELEELKIIKIKINQLNKELDKNKGKLKDINEKKLEDLRNRLNEIKDINIEEFNKKRDIYKEMVKKYEEYKEFKKLEEENKTLMIKINKIRIDDKELEEMRDKLEKIRNIIAKKTVEIKGVIEIIKIKEKFLKEKREELEKIEELKENINKKTKIYEEIILLKNAVIETQKQLREYIITSINKTLEKIWPYIYPYKDYKKVRLNAENGYSFQLYCDEWVEVENVSGGETEALALALRISLALVLTPNLSWLILDEPTHNLDKISTESLAETLQKKLPEIIKQNIIISHDENLIKEGYMNVIRFTRNKNDNGETKIE